MARGQSQAADSNLQTTNALGASDNQKSQDLQNQIIPGYQSLMQTGYLNPQEENAAVTSEEGAATQPFEKEEFRAGNTAAATRNDSSLAAQQDELALQEGRTAGDAAAHLQDQKLAGQEAGLYGLGGLSAQNQQASTSLYGLGPGTLNARAAGGSGDQTALGWANFATGQGGRG